MQRTAWRPMGDGGLTASSFNAFLPDASQPSTIGELTALNDARLNALQDVDMGTAFLSKLSTTEGKVMAGGVAVALLILLLPTSGQGSRRR